MIEEGQNEWEEPLMMISFLFSLAFVFDRKRSEKDRPITIELEGRGLAFYEDVEQQLAPFISKCTHK